MINHKPIDWITGNQLCAFLHQNKTHVLSSSEYKCPASLEQIWHLLHGITRWPVDKTDSDIKSGISCSIFPAFKGNRIALLAPKAGVFRIPSLFLQRVN